MVTAAGGTDAVSPDASVTATVLFTDVVASTELRVRLGEALAEDLRRQHGRLLGTAVEGNRGRVIKGLGDGIMATFASAADAVAAAVAIQVGVDRHNRSAVVTARLGVRVGLSAGDVTFEAGDCFGAPVVEAARICAAARSGQILASQVVRLLTRSQEPCFVPVGSLELKGLPEPVPVLEVDWAAQPASPVPLPVPLERRGGAHFVGRTQEREQLMRAWREATGGVLRIELVGGEPGIGKTRPVSEVARVVHDEAGVVLYGRCDEEPGVPYQPIAEALRDYARECPAEDLRTQLGFLGGELRRVLPGLPDIVRGLPDPVRAEAETERYRLLEAVREFLHGIAATAPVLLVLDDLHWAARPDLALLRHLLRSTERVRLLIVGTYRDTDLGPGHPLGELLADLRRQPEADRLTLEGLSETELVTFIEAAAGQTLDEQGIEFARAVHTETEGNPFFVTEVLSHLAETGWVVRREGTWIASRPLREFGIPEGVREVVARRLDRLSPDTVHVLAVAAVIGRVFDLGLLAEAAELSRDAVLDSLEQGEQARLVAAVGGRVDRYSFAHSLVRSTLYDGLPTPRRCRIHRRIGVALEGGPDADARVAELARHFGEAAGLGEVPRAVEYARRAGDRARASLAFEDAAAHYQRALSALELAESPDAELRCDLQVALGDALHRTGDIRHRGVLDDAARGARALGDARRLADVAVSLHVMGYPSSYGRMRRGVVALLEESLDGLGEQDAGLRARVLAVLASELHLDSNHERRWAIAREALTTARRVNDPVSLAWALDSHLWTTRGSENLEERLAVARELLSLGEEADDLDVEFLARSHLQWDLNELGDVDGASGHLEAMDLLAERLRYPLAAWRAAVRRVGQVLLAGQLADAERLALRAREIGRKGGVPRTLVGVALNASLFGVRYEQGRLAELEDMVAAPLTDALPGFPMWRPLLALLYCETDRLVDAQPHFEWFAARKFANVPRDFAWLASMVALARAAASLGEAASAECLERLLLPHSARCAFVGTWNLGPVGSALGLLAATSGRSDGADRHFAVGLILGQRMRAPTAVARTRVDWAGALRSRVAPEDRRRSSELAGEALEAALELGMGRVAGQARVILAGE